MLAQLKQVKIPAADALGLNDVMAIYQALQPLMPVPQNGGCRLAKRLLDILAEFDGLVLAARPPADLETSRICQRGTTHRTTNRVGGSAGNRFLGAVPDRFAVPNFCHIPVAAVWFTHTVAILTACAFDRGGDHGIGRGGITALGCGADPENS